MDGAPLLVAAVVADVRMIDGDLTLDEVSLDLASY